VLVDSGIPFVQLAVLGALWAIASIYGWLAAFT
jgi:hypothetical protein